VYVTGRDPDTLGKTCAELTGEFGNNVRTFQGDLTRPEIISSLIRTVEAEWRRLDIVVANIGTGRYPSGWDIDDGIWAEALEVNLMGAIKITREAVSIMQRQESGAIVVIASIAGRERIAAPAPYAVAKAALLQYVNYTAESVSKLGIRINAISPGNILFDEGTWDMKTRENPDLVRTYISANVPLGRFGIPEEIASLTSYLVSDEASFITGSNFVIDGGQSREI
jgi:3-oxoacyl-[acyl-carrier protein] reductase